MQTIDQPKYDDWKAKQNGDPYGLECFNYAERWANLMEAQISGGKEIKDIAKDTSHEADTSGITGFMYGAAVSILAQCWKYGEHFANGTTWIHKLETKARKPIKMVES
jgi:hypothetical protein